MLANDPVTQARIDLTTALRAAARHGLNEGVCNHFSMTVPGREDLFLVNPQGLHWSEITPSDLVMADQYAGVALSNEEGDRMCSAMAGKDILFLRNHGVIVSGPTVAQTYDDLYYLERAAMVQVLAMQTGKPLHNIDAKLAEHTANQIAGESQQALLHFESLKRLLDRDEPGWRRLAA